MKQQLVTVADAADALGLSTKQVYGLAADGHLPKAYIGKGTRNFRIPADAVEEWAKTRPADPVEDVAS